MQHILFEQKDPLGIIILNRPKQRNALSIALMKEIQEQLQIIGRDKNIRVVIIKGNGPDFCSGHDLNELKGEHNELEYYRDLFALCSEMMQTIHKIPQPVIAQVHGAATAAGCQLVASCDLAIAESRARFATPGVKIGLFCSTPMVPLSRVIGRRRALEMLLTGRFISSNEALQFGLINRVVEKELLEIETESLATEISKYSFYTISLGKKAFYKQIHQSEKEAYEYAQEVISMNCLSKDAQEGIKAKLNKEQPEWNNR